MGASLEKLKHTHKHSAKIMLHAGVRGWESPRIHKQGRGVVGLDVASTFLHDSRFE